ncbi:hypothetical protein E4T66_18335 [Sinimarinibacterium sp. CAU 1509]|uniref:hypothetical protein n=1 Tax=Sinimarinibacterium sp. CAU 1509 TaxID=2562283 RepID=UPI0010AD0131|nr:hypothetical protein [Sinimarinibacterium sp. CAU 1509]TJY57365.1 hypothetical protein E4T66_18335 [Sinimarinibacterium sp. CAU 1509]
MALNTRYKLSALALCFALTACASAPAARDTTGPTHRNLGPRSLTADQQELRRARAEASAAKEIRALHQQQITQAYDTGVRDTLEEFRGRMQGRDGFVFQPPVLDWVDMPSRVVNGALVPAHKEQVLVAPGRWVEDSYASIPDQALGLSAAPADAYTQRQNYLAPSAPMASQSRFEYVHGE